jgi:hypothetical protein
VGALPSSLDTREAIFARLLVLMKEFDRDTGEKRKQIRDLLEAHPDAFYAAAIQILRGPADSRGLQFLVVLLVTNGLLLRALCDPALDREQAMGLARLGLRADSMADVTLARALADGVECCHDTVQLAQASRLLEILDEITDSTRILSSLVRLLRHSHSYLRSKAVLMIGRGNKSTQWLRQRLSDGDARIRANAVEALWGFEGNEVRDLLQSMRLDPDNRVAGNAILGLYLLGDHNMIAEIWRRSTDQSARSRATAAWVMGETGDPRFTELVAGMLRDPVANVRKRAFSAIEKLKNRAAQLTRVPEFILAGRFVDCDAQAVRRFVLAIGSQDHAVPRDLRPTQLILTEDDKPVISYQVIEKTTPDVISVVFLLPRSSIPGLSWSAAALECLPWKRNGDAWGCLHYVPGVVPAEVPAREERIQFHSDREGISANFRKRRHPAECTDVWTSLWHAFQPDKRPGKRQVIVFSGHRSMGEAGPELVKAVTASQAFVQVISFCPDPALEDFCQRAGGAFLRCPRGEEFSAPARQAYLNLLPRFEIAYEPPQPEARLLRVRLCSPQACGETSLPVVMRAALKCEPPEVV